MKTTVAHPRNTGLMKTARVSFVTVTLAILLFTLTGCKVFDDLITDFEDNGGLNARNDYTVSCVDLMVVQDGPGSTDSRLAPLLKKAVTDGVQATQQTDKGKNIKIGNSLSADNVTELYKYVLKDPSITTDLRRQYLKSVCDKNGSNMLLYGVYTGDDTEIKVLCFLYREDLNDFTVSDPVTYAQNLPDRRQNEIVSKVVRDLLEKSLPDPGQPDSRKISKIVKEAAPAVGATLLSLVIQYLENGNSNGNTDSNSN